MSKLDTPADKEAPQGELERKRTMPPLSGAVSSMVTGAIKLIPGNDLVNELNAIASRAVQIPK